MEKGWLAPYAARGEPAGSLLQLHLQPGASRRGISLEPGALRMRVTSPPHEERANRECLEYLSELLGVAKGRITIVRGARARRKTVVVSGMAPAEVEERIVSRIGAD